MPKQSDEFKVILSILKLRVFGCHISFDRSSAATGLYISVERVTVGCFPIDAIRLYGLLVASISHCSTMIVKKKRIKVTSINYTSNICVFLKNYIACMYCIWCSAANVFKRCRRYELCMKDTRVLFACEALSAQSSTDTLEILWTDNDKLTYPSV